MCACRPETPETTSYLPVTAESARELSLRVVCDRPVTHHLPSIASRLIVLMRGLGNLRDRMLIVYQIFGDAFGIIRLWHNGLIEAGRLPSSTATTT